MARSTTAGNHVVLVITAREAAALYSAAGECLYHDDVARERIPDGRDRAAAYRAWQKLYAARVAIGKRDHASRR